MHAPRAHQHRLLEGQGLGPHTGAKGVGYVVGACAHRTGRGAGQARAGRLFHHPVMDTHLYGQGTCRAPAWQAGRQAMARTARMARSAVGHRATANAHEHCKKAVGLQRPPPHAMPRRATGVMRTTYLYPSRKQTRPASPPPRATDTQGAPARPWRAGGGELDRGGELDGEGKRDGANSRPYINLQRQDGLVCAQSTRALEQQWSTSSCRQPLTSDSSASHVCTAAGAASTCRAHQREPASSGSGVVMPADLMLWGAGQHLFLGPRGSPGQPAAPSLWSPGAKDPD